MAPLAWAKDATNCWWFSTKNQEYSAIYNILYISIVFYISSSEFYIYYISIIVYIVLYIDIHLFYSWGVIGFTIRNLKIFIGTVNHQDIWVLDYYLLTLQQDLAVAKIVGFLLAAHLVSNPN